MKGSHLSLQYLKAFRDLAKTRSFRQAAALNFVTQSAISQQVAYLENYFGKTLIDRQKGQFNLTTEGLLLLDAANAILEIEKNAREAMRQVPHAIAGTVTVESAYSVGIHLLPPLVRNFMKKFPKIVLNLQYSHSDRIIADLLAGLCSVGIIVLPCLEPDKLDVYPFIQEKLVLVCSPYHRMAKRKGVSLGDIEKEPFVAFKKNLQTRQLIDDILHRHGVTVSIIHEGENVETLKRVVEVGGGVSILPEGAILQEAKAKSLVALSIKEGPFYREAGIAIKRGRQLTRAEHTLIHWLSANQKSV